MAALIPQFVSIATPVSVIIIAYQLWQRKKQFTTEFEDQLTDQYREIVYELPVAALLDDSGEEGYQGRLESYYRYVDLTNEQIFLRKEGRVSKSTWENWSAGIDSHLTRSDFENAWQEIHDRDPQSFEELQQYLNPDYHDDPRFWDHHKRATAEQYWYLLWNR